MREIVTSPLYVQSPIATWCVEKVVFLFENVINEVLTTPSDNNKLGPKSTSLNRPGARGLGPREDVKGKKKKTYKKVMGMAVLIKKR